MRSLRGRLIALWFMLVASALATGFVLVASFRQSAAAQVASAEDLTARSCRDIADRFGFVVADWSGPGPAGIDDALRRDLVGVVQVALARKPGIEGGIWSAGGGSLAYAFPTYEGTGPKTDVPPAELGSIADVNAQAAASERPATAQKSGRSQVQIVHACPLPGPMAGLTAWTMTRVFTGSGGAYNRLLGGLAVLAITVFGSAAWLGHLLLAWSRRLRGLEAALASPGTDILPRLEPTGERELDRLVEALNGARDRLTEARLRAHAAERLAAVGRLAAGIAHEIRNPLAAMRLRAENALAAADPARQRSALTIILGQISRLDGLLGDLLATTQRKEPAPTCVDLARFLETCVDAHADLARQHGLAIGVEPAVPASWQARFDAGQIGRALDNLILNAVQNTPPGGRIRLSAERAGDRLVLRVADDGPGVPDTLAGHLFEPFVTGRPDGTGLGLAIVREIARAHGGEARLAPSDEGAVFEVELPWPEQQS